MGTDERPHRHGQDQKLLSPDAREEYIARLRKTLTPMQLCGQERQAVVTWYNSFVDFLKTYRVPIKIFEEEFQLHKLDDPREVLYRPTLDDPHLYDRYSVAIHLGSSQSGIHAGPLAVTQLHQRWIHNVKSNLGVHASCGCT